jgi:bZIP transcription factor
MEVPMQSTMTSFDIAAARAGDEHMAWLTSGLDSALAEASPETTQTDIPDCMETFEWTDFSPRAINTSDAATLPNSGSTEYKVMHPQQFNNQLSQQTMLQQHQHHHYALQQQQQLSNLNELNRGAEAMPDGGRCSPLQCGAEFTTSIGLSPTSFLLGSMEDTMTPDTPRAITSSAILTKNQTSCAALPPLPGTKKRRGRGPQSKFSKSVAEAGDIMFGGVKKCSDLPGVGLPGLVNPSQYNQYSVNPLRKQQLQFRQHQQQHNSQLPTSLQHIQLPGCSNGTHGAVAAGNGQSPSMTAEEKRRQRAERNRWSAEKSRLRRKQYTDDLEREVTALRETNSTLKSRTLGLLGTLRTVDKTVEQAIAERAGFMADVDNNGMALKAALQALDNIKEQCPITFRDALTSRTDLNNTNSENH